MYFADHPPPHFHARYGFKEPKGPMFEPLADVAYFAKVTVDPELGTVVWPNGADLAPEALHDEALSLA